MSKRVVATPCDVGNLILGGLLFASPWVFGYPGGVQSRNAVIVGGAIILLSVAALAALAVLEDAPQALNAVAGGWLFVSPWALKFQGTTALSVNVAIGTIVVVLAGIKLWSMSPIEPQADH